MVNRFVFAFDLHLDLAFLRMQHDRLLAELSDHVKRTLRHTAQRQLLHVLGNAALDDRPQFRRDRKEPIRRTEVVEGLMRPPVVVVLDPRLHPLLRLLEAVELRTGEELRMDRLPESLDLAQGLRVMRAAAEVVDMVFLKLPFKPRLPAPVGVLPAIVCQHLAGQAILAYCSAIHFQHVLGRLTAIQPQPDHIA